MKINRIIWHIALVIVPLILIYALTFYVTNETDISLWDGHTKVLHIIMYMGAQIGHAAVHETLKIKL